jgi:hypothetical protein
MPTPNIKPNTPTVAWVSGYSIENAWIIGALL